MARNLEVGTVWSNCWLIRSLEMPFGGCKDSGTGREGTRHSLELFTEEKTHCIKLGCVPDRTHLHLHGWG